MREKVCEYWRNEIGITGEAMGRETVGKGTRRGIVNTRDGNKTPCGGTWWEQKPRTGTVGNEKIHGFPFPSRSRPRFPVPTLPRVPLEFPPSKAGFHVLRPQICGLPKAFWTRKKWVSKCPPPPKKKKGLHACFIPERMGFHVFCPKVFVGFQVFCPRKCVGFHVFCPANSG